MPTPGHDVYAGLWRFAGKASPENSAKFEALNKPEKASSGSAWILFQSETEILALDGLYLKNVIIRDVTVEYRGGPLRLENVYFVNCEFISPLTARGRALNRALLASPSVKFGSDTNPEPSGL
jgi:hypothetical protein